jgi:DNA-binding transcriptional ArsR family regulator
MSDDNNLLQDAIAALPIPILWKKLGVPGEPKPGDNHSPFRDDKKESFSIYDEGRRAKDHGDGWNGDSYDFFQKWKGLDPKQAFKPFIELAGLGHRLTSGNGTGHFDWNRFVDTVTQAHLNELGTWRGYSLDFCRWLKEQRLIGRKDDRWYFPHQHNGQILSAHVRIDRHKWFFEPKLRDLGLTVRPLVVGNLQDCEKVIVSESQWDLFAFLDRTGFYLQNDVAGVATRGASNAKLLAGIIPGSARIILLPQNDNAGQKWLDDAVDQIGLPVKVLRTPGEFADLNEWTLGGSATLNTIAEALRNAAIRDRAHVDKSQEPDAIDSKETKDHDEKLFAELLSKYQQAVCTSEQLENLSISARKFLIGSWMREGDSGFVFGERGSGKTWLIDAIATHLSAGEDLFDWTVPEPCNVLLVDGEMPLDESRDRLKGMSPSNTGLHVLHHEKLFDLGLAMNLTQPRQQRIITEICTRKEIKLLILDNLSCLFSGIKENDADEWEKVLNWLLDLRRKRIAVLIVHHASRSGTMRGTSKREDAAFWVIRVDEVQGRNENELGARFQTTFTKQRNSKTREWTLEWTFQTEADGRISIGCNEISFDSKVLQLIQDGLTSATDIAEELGVAKSTVSKATKRLEGNKLIERNGRQYKPRGVMNV